MIELWWLQEISLLGRLIHLFKECIKTITKSFGINKLTTISTHYKNNISLLMELLLSQKSKIIQTHVLWKILNSGSWFMMTFLCFIKKLKINTLQVLLIKLLKRNKKKMERDIFNLKSKIRKKLKNQNLVKRQKNKLIRAPKTNFKLKNKF